MNRSEYLQERYALDAAYEAAAEEKERKQQQLDSLKEAIKEAMDDITANMNQVCTFDYYMTALSYYIDHRDYEEQADFIKGYVEDLEELEQQEWEEE